VLERSTTSEDLSLPNWQIEALIAGRREEEAALFADEVLRARSGRVGGQRHGDVGQFSGASWLRGWRRALDMPQALDALLRPAPAGPSDRARQTRRQTAGLLLPRDAGDERFDLQLGAHGLQDVVEAL